MKGPGLHALVIGVSDYQFLPGPNELPKEGVETLGLTKVDIPATGAFRVAQWLKKSYWHPKTQIKTIRLLLSPSKNEITPTEDPPKSDDNLRRAALAEEIGSVPRANKDNVWQAMQDWKADCKGDVDGIAILYVSGHGIQWGDSQDAIVLLEDFSKDEQFLNQAIGINQTVKGMRGPDMPQVQLYFVDACQIQPDEYKKFENAGSPLGLTSMSGQSNTSSTPIYFGACPQTAATGRNGPGTYLAEALVTCLEGSALVGPDSQSSLPVAKEYWHVLVSNLTQALQDSVNEIASRDNEEQQIVQGGMLRPAIFCASPTTPVVTLVIDVEPDEAAKAASAEIWDWSGLTQLRKPMPCWERPLKIAALPAALYQLKVSAADPHKTLPPIQVTARPPVWKQTITLP